MDHIQPATGNAVSYLRAVLRDILAFCCKPEPAPAMLDWGPSLIAALSVLVAIDLAVGWAIVSVLDQISTSLMPLPEELEFEETFWESFFLLVILAPLFEEPTYRGFLTGRRAGLRFGLIAICVATTSALLLYFSHLPSANEWLMPGSYAVTALLLVGLAQWLLTRKSQTDRPAWFYTHYHHLIWASSVLFGLAHVANYETLTNIAQIIVVLPQAIGGLLLAYTRTRFGLLAAIAHHAAFNGVYFLTSL